MCIIVAKNKGVKMPSMDTLRNCFDNNPDGAGFMLANGDAVYGFKGLMTFEEFEAELKKAKKSFGSLDKLSVVMHFRISTHGSVVSGNTHPFPLKGGYREMRRTEWVADQGFAHNGIILQTSDDDDITKHNVSDTMVFAKKYINPIAKYANIASDSALLDMLYELANSKLCFLNKKGKLATRGKFFEENGVLYSNTSFEDYYYRKSRSINWSNYYNYDWQDVTTTRNNETQFRISDFEIDDYIEELAEENGYYEIPEGSEIEFHDGTVFYVEKYSNYYFDDNGWIYRFDKDSFNFTLVVCDDEYTELRFGLEKEEYDEY